MMIKNSFGVTRSPRVLSPRQLLKQRITKARNFVVLSEIIVSFCLGFYVFFLAGAYALGKYTPGFIEIAFAIVSTGYFLVDRAVRNFKEYLEEN